MWDGGSGGRRPAAAESVLAVGTMAVNEEVGVFRPGSVARSSSMQLAMQPSVEISPSVYMPLLSFGVTNSSSLFVSLGGRGLDTAFDYGDSAQAEVGSAVAKSGLPRSELFVTTKIPCCPSAFVADSTYSDHCHSRRSPNQTAADIAHDLQVLGLSYADAILMHWPCDSAEDTLATWRVLERAAFAGQTRAIGVSNFNSSALESLLLQARIKPALNQVAYSIGNHNGTRYRNQTWGRDDSTRALCKKAGVTLQAYSPLGGWALGGTSRILHDPTVLSVAAAHNRSAAAIALRWVVQQGIPLVTSSDSKEYDLEDLSIFSFNLSTAEMNKLAAV